MPKRERITNDSPKDDEDKKLEIEAEDDDDEDAKRGRMEGNHEDEEDDGDEDEEDEYEDEDEEESHHQQSFVAWLEEGASKLSIGELHFSNVEHTGSQDDRNSYCVVYEMMALPVQQQDQEDEDEDEDEESESPPHLFTFTNGFPFRILPASACVGIQLEPVAENTTTASATITDADDDDDDDDDDDEECLVYTTYSMNADMHQVMFEELNDTSSENTYKKVNTSSSLSTGTTSDEIINGVNAWWKAGEAKTGWDLQKIPQTDYTTANTISCCSDVNNTLLHLYGELCAFKPLTPNDSRDTIEERFEWRTCLCVYFAWAVPNERALNLLKSLKKPILEIGAGTGYWAYLLGDRGVDIVAYDMEESHDGHKHRFRHSMVRDGGVEQAALCSKDGDEHKGRALFLCWPDIVGDSASDDKDRGTFGFDCLKTYDGDTVIYVGELGQNVVRAKTNEGWGDPFPPGGSSASEAFQTELKDNWRMTERVQLPNWPPYNSHLTVWVRK
jgi:hypothetical protein